MAEAALEPIRGPLIDAQVQEIAGEVRSAIARYRVKISRDASGGVFFAALAHPDLPKAGALLNEGYPDLKVERRSIDRVVGMDAAQNTVSMIVVVEYGLQRQSPGFSLRGGVSLNQVSTMNDKDGNPIEVTHAGETQRGRVNVMRPQGNFVWSVTYEDADPESIMKTWIGKVNSVAWRGGGIGEWLVTEIRYDLVNDADDTEAAFRRYDFEFTFERNPTGWDPEVAWKDENGIHPAGLQQGIGIKTVPEYTPVAFAPTFPDATA